MLVGVLIGLYFLWPLVHQQLVRHYRTDPWKLAGWAMYSAPSARVRITVLGVDADEQRVRIDPRKPADLAAALEEFVSRRRTLGLFVEPEAIALRLLEIFPDHREWTLVVDQVGLNSENWLGVLHRSVYRYPIDADGLGPVDVDYPVVPERQESLEAG